MRIRRTRHKPRFSLLTAAGMAGGAMASFSGEGNIGIVPQVISCFDGSGGQVVDIPRVLVRETIGYDYQYKTWHVPAFTALTGLGMVGSAFAGKVIKPSTFDGIPYIGKRIKL